MFDTETNFAARRFIGGLPPAAGARLLVINPHCWWAPTTAISTIGRNGISRSFVGGRCVPQYIDFDLDSVVQLYTDVCPGRLNLRILGI